MGIKRFNMVALTYHVKDDTPSELLVQAVDDEDGKWVDYNDHASAMAEKDQRIGEAENCIETMGKEISELRAAMAEKEDELIDLRRDYEFLDGSYTELQAKCERMEEVIRCASNLAREYRKHGKGSIELSELCDAIALTEKK